MKKIALYIILFSYTTIILKPVSPYISDTVAHIFYYTQHMATVHYQNGKLHVHKEIVDNAKKNDPAKESPSSKKETSSSDHISLLQNYGQQALYKLTKYNIPYAPTLLYNHLRGDYPPPRAWVINFIII